MFQPSGQCHKQRVLAEVLGQLIALRQERHGALVKFAPVKFVPHCIGDSVELQEPGEDVRSRHGRNLTAQNLALRALGQLSIAALDDVGMASPSHFQQRFEGGRIQDVVRIQMGNIAATCQARSRKPGKKQPLIFAMPQNAQSG